MEENSWTHRQSFLKVGIIAVHFVDDHEARQVEFVDLLPGDFGADLDACDRIDQDDSAIRHAQG